MVFVVGITATPSSTNDHTYQDSAEDDHRGPLIFSLDPDEPKYARYYGPRGQYGYGTEAFKIFVTPSALQGTSLWSIILV